MLGLFGLGGVYGVNIGKYVLFGRELGKEVVQWVFDLAEFVIGDPGVDFGCFAARMAQEFLDISEIDALIKQVGSEAVPQGMRRGMLSYAGLSQCFAKDILNTSSTVLLTLWAFKQPLIGPESPVIFPE